MKRYFLLLILSTFIFNFDCSAQYRRKTQKLADALFQSGDYYNALKYYGDLLSIDSTTAKPNYQYAEALRMTNDYKKALYYYKKTYRLDRGKQYPDALFWLAEMYKSQYEYSKAKRYYKRAERYYRGNRNTLYYARVKQEQLACNLATKLYQNPLDVEIKNLGDQLNSHHSEFGGYLMNDTHMVFSSQRPETDTVLNYTSFNIRIYEAFLKKNEWVTSDNRLEQINSELYHTANGVLNTRKNKFYFTICDTNGCSIFQSIYYDGEWREPKNVGKKINKMGTSSTHPYIAKMNGEEVMFFVSDREGGYGRRDIWYAVLYSNGVFDDPVNAGEMVNTPGDEITPFFHTASGNLYFSSDWHMGMGGFDVFKSNLNDGVFSGVENLGYPINSGVMDFYFRVFENQALLASNRIGSISIKSETCCNDIYALPYEIKEKKKKNDLELAYDSLVAYLPLQLFFHNDRPNPRSNKVETEIDYLQSFDNYISLIPKYKKEYSRGLRGDSKLDAIDDIVDFFDLRVKEGAVNLQKFTVLLSRELEKGRSIGLTVKGYASPLSKSDYNANLTLRRISSIENFFENYEQGLLKKYLVNGQLVIKREPYGEGASNNKVSDNVNDKRNSIYSKEAAYERRVEIISLDLERSQVSN